MNMAMRMNCGVMCTYRQKKLGLSTYYDKQWVLPDSIQMELIEYHIEEEEKWENELWEML